MCFNSSFLTTIAVLLFATMATVQAFVLSPSPLRCVRAATTTTTTATTTELGMGKSINKQAELRRKMELAKQQKQQQQQAGSSSSSTTTSSNASQSTKNIAKPQILSDEEIKQRNDRKRFAELLQQQSAVTSVWNDYAGDEYRNQDQVQEDIDAARRGEERLFEGDPVPPDEDCFANLVLPQTEQTLGRAGMERLVPWLRKGMHDDDYLIVLCDPRPTSPDLQTAVRHVWTDCTADIRQRLIVINADRPSQNRKWIKKQGWTTATGPMVYCDEKMEWMRAHTALGDTRWSMTLFVLAAGRVQKLVRDVDVYTVSDVVPKAIAAYKQAKL